jgi:outer membrane biosynthesis protein TonB
MLRLSKIQFSRAIEGSGVTNDTNRPPYAQNAQKQPRRISKFLVTALVVALGIGAGWVGGKVLNGRMSHSTDAVAPGDVSTGDNPAPTSEPQPESRPAKHAETPEKSVTPSQPAPEDEQPAVAPETRPKDPKEAESKEAEPKAPPKVPRVEKEEEADKAAAEDPSKEIGRKALKKINKESNMNANSPTKKEKAANKNENPDRQ